jgi:hypothetical protein
VEAPNVDPKALLVTTGKLLVQSSMTCSSLLITNSDCYLDVFAFEPTKMNVSAYRLWRLVISIWASSKEDAVSRRSVQRRPVTIAYSVVSNMYPDLPLTKGDKTRNTVFHTEYSFGQQQCTHFNSKRKS